MKAVQGLATVGAAVILLTAAVAAPESQPRPTQPGAAQESPPHEEGAGAEAEQERLRHIRSQIEELRQRLVESESQAGTILDALDEIDLKIAVLGREAIVLQADLESTRRAEAAARNEVEAARRRQSEAEQALRRWLVEIDRAGSTSQLRLLLASSNTSTLAAAQRASEALALAEASRVRNLRVEQASLETALQSLEANGAKLASLQDQMQTRQQELRAARGGKQDLLRGIRAREEVGQQALASL
ncbi:MAG TPA: hypothetical protein VFB49_12750, partial [Patescibacteria group bacterium]|nr:hypothetical protein [Patescibacteria group bacterium]